MKYCVENDLSIFEFHDSDFSYVCFDGKDLVISASMVNVNGNVSATPIAADKPGIQPITIPIAVPPAIIKMLMGVKACKKP